MALGGEKMDGEVKSGGTSVLGGGGNSIFAAPSNEEELEMNAFGRNLGCCPQGNRETNKWWKLEWKMGDWLFCSLVM